MKQYIKMKLKDVINRILDTPSNRKEDILRKAFQAYDKWGLRRGDYLEFGVYKGDSFIAACKLAKNIKSSVKLFAFDSFEGLPTGLLSREKQLFKPEQYQCSLEGFKRNLYMNGVDPNSDNVHIIRGQYNEVLNHDLRESIGISHAAIVMIDCDLYESAKNALDFITEFVHTGTIILFDDWYCFGGDPNLGVRRALLEWLDENPNINTIFWDRFGLSGIAYFVQKTGE